MSTSIRTFLNRKQVNQYEYSPSIQRARATTRTCTWVIVAAHVATHLQHVVVVVVIQAAESKQCVKPSSSACVSSLVQRTSDTRPLLTAWLDESSAGRKRRTAGTGILRYRTKRFDWSMSRVNVCLTCLLPPRPPVNRPAKASDEGGNVGCQQRSSLILTCSFPVLAFDTETNSTHHCYTNERR